VSNVLFGKEMSQEMLTGGQKASPKILLGQNFQFNDVDVLETLKKIVA
jgi:NAD dependent epimerase/dehydratase family enzyme